MLPYANFKVKTNFGKLRHAFYLVFSGNCTKIIAVNIKTQPKISLKLIAPPVKFQPRATKITVVSPANTDSKLIKIDADVGSVYFCPIIWRVYATPQDIIPEYPIDAHELSTGDR